MIEIEPTRKAAIGKPSKKVLLSESLAHIGHVQKAMAWFAGKLIEAGAIHDHTKISGIDDFYDSFSKGVEREEFNTEKWYQSHLQERHHLNERCPDDVNLIDVLERVADICMAGMARNGYVYNATLDADILQKAFTNTVKLLAEEVALNVSVEVLRED